MIFHARVVGGRIVEQRLEYDPISLLTQLGAIETPATYRAALREARADALVTK